jgi:hypothetical protein
MRSLTSEPTHSRRTVEALWPALHPIHEVDAVVAGGRAQQRILVLAIETKPLGGNAHNFRCIKTPSLAARVETSRRNCIPGSQIILHMRGVMPSSRIVFSTFRDCMSFYTARVKNAAGDRVQRAAYVRIAPNSGHKSKPSAGADVLARAHHARAYPYNRFPRLIRPKRPQTPMLALVRAVYVCQPELPKVNLLTCVLTA